VSIRGARAIKTKAYGLMIEIKMKEMAEVAAI
jgi:hypothetical protein